MTASAHQSAMDFPLPEPVLLDEEIVTHAWPLPQPRAWAPVPRPSLIERVRLWLIGGEDM